MKYIWQTTRRSAPLLPAVLLMITATATPMAAQADPIGQLVNLIMNKVLDDADKEAEEDKNHYRSNLPSANRTIPKESKQGTLSPPANARDIKINGDDYQLAFNSRIRDEGNRLVQTGAIRQSKRVRYTLNTQEQVDKIWLLAPNEK